MVEKRQQKLNEREKERGGMQHTIQSRTIRYTISQSDFTKINM